MAKSSLRLLECHQVLAVVLMRVLVVLYCFIMVVAGIAFGKVGTVSKAIGLWRPDLNAAVFTCAGILHVIGLLELCRKRKAVVKPEKPEKKPVHHNKNLGLGHRMSDSITVLIDTVGKREEHLLMVTELVEIPVQTIQCYSFFESGVFPIYGLVYVSILSLNCFVIFFSQQNASRLLAMDAMVDLVVGAAMPILLMLSIVFEAISNVNIVSDFVWMAAGLNIAHQFAVTSAIDLVISVFPLFLAHFHINLLVDRWIRHMQAHVKVRGKFKWFGRFFFLWGVMLLILTAIAHSGQGCDNTTCIHENKRWFSDPKQCFCVTRVYQCRTGEFRSPYEMLEKDLSGNNRQDTVLHIKVDGCRMEKAPEIVGNLSQLQNLWILDSNLTEFNLPMKQMTDLTTLYLPGNQLREIPNAFRHFGSSLIALTLANLLISQLPDWIPKAWQHLTILDLGSTQLKEFPMPLLELVNLELLTLSRLPIELPSNLTLMAKLRGLYVTSCGLSTIPQLSSKNFPKLKYIGLSNNYLSLSELPWTVEQIQQSNQRGVAFEMLALAGNPACEDPQVQNTSACAPLCSPDCTARHRSSHHCRHECNTLSCNYHDGKCAFESS